MPSCALFSSFHINLFVQTLYQIVVLLILQFMAEPIFSATAKVKRTMILTTFVLCQVFNYTNGSRLEKLEGMHRLVIVTITIALQVVMVEVLKKFADGERLNLKQWCACLVIAAMSWPIGWSLKYIPISEKPVIRHKTAEQQQSISCKIGSSISRKHDANDCLVSDSFTSDGQTSKEV